MITVLTEKSTPGPLAIAIGNFDGIHLGHQDLIKACVEHSRQHRLSSAVLTFHPHPQSVINPDAYSGRLFDWEDQKSQMKRLGIEFLITKNFSREFSELEPSVFLQESLLQEFQIRHLVVGYDFHFGYQRKGDIYFLQKFCHEKSISVQVIPARMFNQKTISTSQIRLELAHGHIEKANELLGRRYYVRGVVGKGDRRGSQLGFPTANIQPTTEFLPQGGVYITQVKYKGQLFPSVTNIGTNPTFVLGENHPLRVETHILDFTQNIYGEQIEVEFHRFIRSEKKFSSIMQLVEQIQNDTNVARLYFKEVM